MRLTRRPALVALVTVVGLVVLAVTPALADPPYTFGFDAGNLYLESLGAAPDIDFNIGEEPEEDPCGLYDPSMPLVIEISVSGSPPNFTIEVVSGSIGKFSFGDPSTNTWYQGDLAVSDPAVTGADNTGTLTSSGPGTWTVTLNLWLELDLYEVDPPDCEKDDLACELLLVWDDRFSQPLTGTYTGTVPPTAGTVISMSGTGLTVVNGPCDAGLAGSFDGASVAATGIAVRFVP